jgi:hypothetical protein
MEESMSQTLQFTLPDGRERTIPVRYALNAGYAGVLLTAACDRTDRALEVHGVAWSKQSAPDLLVDVAWPLAEIEDELDRFTVYTVEQLAAAWD